jgi:predicted ATPase
VHLEPQAFDLLVCLIDQRDRVVSKVELLDGVWGHRFVSEANLTTRVKEVRRAVGDDGTRQHTVANVRGRGYRFVADVQRVDESSDAGLVGRDPDLASLRDALARARLVTLTGPGGVGKSTLARAVAADAGRSGADGVHLIELVALDPDAPVLPAVARALDVLLDTERAGDAVRAIARLDALLVLDNCEHVVDAVAALVHDLLHAHGSKVRLLATSQVPLGVSGESLVEVRPLPVDEASELFARRAREALASWDAADGADRIDRLVAQLDGLPLTIEMAAARVRSMTLDDLERMIADRRGLLQMSHRTPAKRHRSLESLVTWSAQLLDPQQHRRFTEFSVFAGRVTASDAAAVLAPDAAEEAAVDLAALAERSLLVVDLTGTETRYSMLSTVRDVAGRWLEASGAVQATRARHAEHVTAVLRDVDDVLRTPRELDGRRRLDALVDETRAAFRWAEHDCVDLAGEMSAALFHAAHSSLWQEPVEWSRSLLARHGGDELHFPGAVLLVAGAGAHRGDLADARAMASRVASTGAGRIRALALELLADIALYEGDLDGAARASDDLGRLGLELGDSHASAFGVADAALARVYGGDAAGALELIDSTALGPLAPTDGAWVAYARGDALSALGAPEAADAFRTAIELGRTVGNRFVVSVSRVSLATEHARVGELRLALDGFAIALRDFLRHGNQTHAITAIRNLVGVLAAVGDDRGAAILAGAVSDDGLRVSYGIEAERISDTLDEVRRRAGAAQLEAWFEEGRTLDLDRVRVAAELVDQHRR